MRLATGNDLASGAVVWWTGGDWSRHIAEAVDVGAGGEAIVAREEAMQRVNTGYVIDAAPGPLGPVPLHIKQRIRAAGPTTHPELCVKPAEAGSGSYVI